MLNKILSYLKNSKEVINVKKMAHDLKIDEPALEEMLDFLVKKKKLMFSRQSISQGPNKCRGCSLCSSSGKNSIKYYYLPKGN